jgi:rubrerythrin
MYEHRPMTKDALLSAFSGESMAHMRYLIYSDIAEREGFHNVARLFKAIAYSEYIHARNHLNLLRGYDEDVKIVSGAPVGPGDTSNNLSKAIRGEEYEVKEMYPIFMKIAETQGNASAVKTFRYAYEAEKIHAVLYKKAKERVDSGLDIDIDGKVWICKVCGHTIIGKDPPAKCPICSATKEQYVGF